MREFLRAFRDGLASITFFAAPSRRPPFIQMSVEEALRSDWQKVGNDLRKVMDSPKA